METMSESVGEPGLNFSENLLPWKNVNWTWKSRWWPWKLREKREKKQYIQWNSKCISRSCTGLISHDAICGSHSIYLCRHLWHTAAHLGRLVWPWRLPWKAFLSRLTSWPGRSCRWLPSTWRWAKQRRSPSCIMSWGHLRLLCRLLVYAVYELSGEFSWVLLYIY